MDFRLSEELILLKGMVHDFVDRELKPHENEVERADRVAPELRKSIRDKARDLGLLGLNIPEEEGGAGLGVLALCVVREELGRTSYAMAQVVKPTPPLLLFGNEDQKEKYLRPYMRNEREYAFALSEPNAGSDAAAIQTTAVPDGDAFVLNGTKHFTTDGDIADFFVVFALTDKALRARGGITAFLIDRGTPGFTVGRPVETLGWRGIGHVELVFQDCRVPAASVLGEVGEGFRLAMRWIGHGRLSVASYSLGVAQSMLDLAVDHSRQRETFGKPISDRQAVQWMLVESAMEIYAGRGMVRHAAWMADEGIEFRKEAAMAKVHCTEMAARVVDRALQIHGGMGYTKELPIERHYRDLRHNRISEGTSEILRFLIARELLRS